MSEKTRFAFTYASPERKTQAGSGRDPNDSMLKKPAKPVVNAILWGTVSCLLFGLGLTCVLEWSLFVPGVICGLLGIAGMAMAPALYDRWNKRMTEAEHRNASPDSRPL